MTTLNGHLKEAHVATRTMPITEVKASLLQLVTEVGDTGDEIIITRRGKPVARLVPTQRPNSLLGSVIIPDDLDWWELPDEWSDPAVSDPVFGTDAEL
jgi:hypothetical protein